MDEETAGKTRGAIRRVTIRNVKDTGQTQTASAEVAAGIWRDNVEVMGMYGISSSVPEDGALAIMLSVGGDEGDPVLLPLGNPSNRMGGLAQGDVLIHTSGGDKIHLKADGNLDINLGSAAVLSVPGGVTIDTPKVHITGDLEVDGEVRDHTGTMQKMRDQYNAHGHPDASPPPGPAMD